MIQTGWTPITEDAEYPSILTRLPRKVTEADANDNGSGSEADNRQSSDSSEEDDIQIGGGAPTRMTEESDASDDDLPPLAPPIVQRVSLIFCDT